MRTRSWRGRWTSLGGVIDYLSMWESSSRCISRPIDIARPKDRSSYRVKVFEKISGIANPSFGLWFGNEAAEQLSDCLVTRIIYLPLVSAGLDLLAFTASHESQSRKTENLSWCLVSAIMRHDRKLIVNLKIGRGFRTGGPM